MVSVLQTGPLVVVLFIVPLLFEFGAVRKPHLPLVVN